MITVIIDMTFGDNGKGRLCDWYSEEYDVVARQGGSENSGHTIYVDGKKTVLSQLPAGVLHSDVICVLCHGMAINPISLAKEIISLEEAGVSFAGRLFISNKAHVILDHHREVESSSGAKDKIGTTGKGVGPCFADKAYRSGLRLQDLLNQNLKAVEFGFPNEEFVNALKVIKPYVTDTVYLINSFVNQKLNILFEGHQGSALDWDFQYPYCTSTNTVAGSVCTGAGISPLAISGVIGLQKAYMTRVGRGPFPTELVDNPFGTHLASVGKEFGAVTGRPRRVGWLDIPLLKYAVMVNGCQMLAITKLDVLSGLKEIQICTSYEDTDIVPYDLSMAQPQYETFPGWDEDISQARSWDELPVNAQNYLRFIEEKVGIPISLVSVGPDRYDMIDLTEEAAKKQLEKQLQPLVNMFQAGFKDILNKPGGQNIFSDLKLAVEKIKEETNKLGER